MNTSSENTPSALVGLASRVIASSTDCEPSSETGSQPTIQLITCWRRTSFRRTTPASETSTIESGASENSTRYAIPAACWGRRCRK